jgi:hypothetical protein
MFRGHIPVPFFNIPVLPHGFRENSVKFSKYSNLASELHEDEMTGKHICSAGNM